MVGGVKDQDGHAPPRGKASLPVGNVEIDVIILEGRGHVCGLD